VATDRLVRTSQSGEPKSFSRGDRQILYCEAISVARTATERSLSAPQPERKCFGRQRKRHELVSGKVRVR